MVNNMFEVVVGKSKGIFNIITLVDIFISFICFCLGLFLFYKPDTSNEVVSIIIGSLLIANGIISIISYLRKKDIELFNNNLIYGVFLILAGVIAIYVGRLLAIFLAINLIIIGVQRINYSLVLKKFSETSWLINCIIGLFLTVIGIITIFGNDDTIVKVCGICLIGYGLINIVNLILLRKRSEYFLK